MTERKYECYGVVPKDQMTALERDRAISKGLEVDRMRCCLDGGETMAPLLGYSIKEYYHSSEMMANVETYMYETFGTDGVGLSTTLRGMAEAMGAEISYSDNNVAQLMTPAVKLKEAEGAKLIDVDKDGRLHIILEGLRILKGRVGKECPISATVTGPFTVAAMALGTEQLLMGMIKKPDKVKALLEIIVENNRRYIDRLLDMGLGIGFADPVSSTTLISADMYEEFSYPYFKQNVEYIKKNGGGCGLHICGKSKELWPLLNTLPIGCFGLDNIESIREAKEILGPHMAIQGNVPPVDIMKLGKPEDVIEAARICMREGFDSENGYILTSGCQMPVGTPEENMHALMDAVRLFGRYPFNLEEM